VSQLSVSHPLNDDDDEFQFIRLYFGSTFNAKRLSQKLSAISDLYEDAAALSGVNADEYPLVITDIQVGSLSIAAAAKSKEALDWVKAILDFGSKVAQSNKSNPNKRRETLTEQLKRLNEIYRGLRQMRRTKVKADKWTQEWEQRCDAIESTLIEKTMTLLEGELWIGVDDVTISLVPDDPDPHTAVEAIRQLNAIKSLRVADKKRPSKANTSRSAKDALTEIQKLRTAITPPELDLGDDIGLSIQ
jgi:hypothetical protein